VAEKVFNEDPYTPEMAERFASAPPPEENPLLNNATVRGDEPQRRPEEDPRSPSFRNP
jgi:hypothetical protein